MTDFKKGEFGLRNFLNTSFLRKNKMWGSDISRVKMTFQFYIHFKSKA
ncbi:hypothetical protein LEP1GSC048_1349 [Leptospira santarosai serovar Shermani str. 1342KT]|nr:hypothetical protein LEP1GSC048_1349 [Leptospira santarosai serovar Shermani str. 1342KT]